MDIKQVLDQLPALSPNINTLMELLREEYVEPEVLETHLIACPVIAGKVLQIANSSFYGLSRQINSIKEATIILGQHTLRGLVYSLAVIDQYKIPKEPKHFSYERIWLHSLYSACLARVIAEKRNFDESSIFTACLFTNFGLLVIDSIYKNEVNKAFTLTRDKAINFRKSIYKHTELDFIIVSAEALNFWKFPNDTCQLIRGFAGNEKENEVRIIRYAQFVSSSFFLSPLRKDVPAIASKTIDIAMEGLDFDEIFTKTDELFKQIAKDLIG